MKLPPIPFVVLDTETTGFLPRTHRIIEFASIRVEEGNIADTYEQLFSIFEEIPSTVRVLTRITSKDLEGQPSFVEQAEKVLGHLPAHCVLVGQNLGFDLSMLKGEGIDLSDRPWIDTSLLASLVFPELKSYSLHFMSTALALHHEPAHRAMGDVRATLELLGHIWQRLEELPPDLVEIVRDIMTRSTPGYRMLFEVLESKRKSTLPWLKTPSTHISQLIAHSSLAPLGVPPPGTVALHEESLHPDSLQVLIDAAAKDKSVTHWIAVKNLESMIRKVDLPEHVRVLYPPNLLLDPQAAKRLQGQETYTADEATLAVKIIWFRPSRRGDIAVHGGERDVWNGKLACTESSAAYTDQFAAKPSAFIVDHRQLLAFLAEPLHAAQGALHEGNHIIIDDASMLEDTATKAYGHFCALDDLRAAAQGNDLFMKLVDLAVLWAEKTRGAQDTHLMTPADLTRPETKAMREQIDAFLAESALPSRSQHLLSQLHALLCTEQLASSVRWIETRPNGSLFLHAAPERVDALLSTSLYKRFGTTLIIPEGSNGLLPEVLPPRMPTIQADPLPLPPCTVQVTFREDRKVADVLRSPPPGRTIVLASSKRSIEQLFVRLTEELEEKGITLICQGFSGGQGRMEADFLAATPPVVWLLTPWMYEGIELLDGGVDHLILETIPFDHPSHPVFAQRKNHYKNAFDEYCLPRVEHRLFRLIRTFCRHRTERGDVTILDGRLREKGYGPRIRSYIETVSGVTMELVQQSAQPEGKAKKKSDPQQALF